MTSIKEIARAIADRPAPVVFPDTCNLIDLFRVDPKHPYPLSSAADVETAAYLVRHAAMAPPAVHIVVPELVPREFTDNSRTEAARFSHLIERHDRCYNFLHDLEVECRVAAGPRRPAAGDGLLVNLRRLADELLASGTVIEHDQTRLNRAINRLIAKSRPSHAKEIKDSINLEHCLGLCAELRRLGSSVACAFVSSNTKDFAAENSAQLHPDLQPGFDEVGLQYFVSLNAAVGRFRADRHLP